jgi:hypothetical protein
MFRCRSEQPRAGDRQIQLNMNKTNPSPPLAEKQLWRMGDRYVLIFELGKMLVHYKSMKQPGQKGVWTQSTTKSKLVEYLKFHSAVLVTASPA